MSTVQEIYDRLALSKATMQELHGYVVSSDAPGAILDNAQSLIVDAKSGSKVANWRLWLWIMAVESWILENLFSRHRQEVTGIIETRRPHTLRWYAGECKKYQHGFALMWDGIQFKYGRDDAESKIIKYASASEKFGKVVLKVAKETGGIKIPLSAPEKTAFEQFWQQWKDAGTMIEVVSTGPDQLKIAATIIYDGMVMNPDDSLIRDSSVHPVSGAIKAFLGSIEFDATLRLSKLTDAIQTAEGVADVKITGASAKSQETEYKIIELFVTAASGYFALDAASTITYLPNVNVGVITT